MKWRKYAIGLFGFLFLLSGAVLGLLLVDENQDLSSRASIGIGNDITTLERLSEQSGWQTETFPGLLRSGQEVKVGFPLGTWLLRDGTLVNEVEGVTVRLSSTATSTSTLLGQLPTDYKLKQELAGTATKLVGSSVQSFEYEFFNSLVYVQTWEIALNGESVRALVVLPSLSKQVVVEDLLANSASFGSSDVRGASDELSDSAKAVALVRPSVVLIVSSLCSEATVTSNILSNKEYGFCIGGTGSGFFISEEGHVATNGHVVSFVPSTVLAAGVKTGALKELIVDLLWEATRELGTELPREVVVAKVGELYSSPDAMLRFVSMLSNLEKEGLLNISQGEYKFYIQLGKTPIQVSNLWTVNTGKDIVEASLVGSDYKEMTAAGFNSSDVAILKINETEETIKYPALELFSGELAVGTPIQVIGFPGLVSGKSSSLLLDTSASAEPTVTRGVVSALKEAKGDRKRLIQTDASITNGNSGGPAVDESGRVVGIATYGILDESVGGNYNFLRDIEDLKALMQQHSVVSKTSLYDDWRLGLESFWLDYFRFAASDFEKVKKSYPLHPTVDLYLSRAEAKKGTVQDKTPRFTRSQRKIMISMSGGMMGLSVVGAMSLAGWEIVERKKRVVVPPPQPPVAVV